eukprot:4972886-Ditylum_brightwellii.AAC.1
MKKSWGGPPPNGIAWYLVVLPPSSNPAVGVADMDAVAAPSAADLQCGGSSLGPVFGGGSLNPDNKETLLKVENVGDGQGRLAALSLLLLGRLGPSISHCGG